jgi:hypothetical protein
VPRGCPLSFLFGRPTRIHWGRDDWQDISDALTQPDFLGLHVAELAAERLAGANVIRFAYQDVASGEWGAGDHAIRIV